MDSSPQQTLKEAFTTFAQGKTEMDGKQFAKLCKDCGLLCTKFTSTDADLCHAKNWNKTTKKQSYDQFVQKSIPDIAAKTGTTFEAISQKICSVHGPQFKGTQAEYNKFHDDKSLYTGVYANGGPDTGGSGKIGDLSQLCDRTAADNRGVKK